MHRHDRDAHAEGSREDGIAVRNLQLRNFVADLFGTLTRNLEVCTRQNDTEDFTFVAARNIFGAHVTRQALAQFPQQLFDGVTALPDGGGMDSVSALLRFVEIVRTDGYICSRLDSVEAADIFATAMKNNFDVGSVIIDEILNGGI